MSDVQIDGKPRTLKFTAGAMEQLEIQSGKHLGWMLEGLLTSWGFAPAAWFLWAGLQHEPKPPRIEEIRAVLDAAMASGDGIVQFRQPIYEAYVAFTGPPKKIEPEAGSLSPTSGSGTG